MSVHPVNLAAASGPAAGRAADSRASGQYDTGQPGFAETLAQRQVERVRPSDASSPRPHSGETGQRSNERGAERTRGPGPADNGARTARARPSEVRPEPSDGRAAIGRSPAGADRPDSAAAAGGASDTRGHAGSMLDGTGSPGPEAGDGPAHQVEPTSDRDSNDTDSPTKSADDSTSDPLIGVIDPALLPARAAIAGENPARQPDTRPRHTVTTERAGQVHAPGARARADRTLPPANLADVLSTREGGSAAESVQQAGFNRPIERTVALAGGDATARSAAAHSDTGPVSMSAMASATPSAIPSGAAAGHPAAAAVPAGAMFAGPVDAPLGSDAWQRAVTRQSLRLSHADGGRAELTLYPRELGQLQISLKMGEQAQLHFSSPHAHVRAAVESALPQLRHAFAEAGIALGDTSVGDQRSQQDSSAGQHRPADFSAPEPANAVVDSRVAVTDTPIAHGRSPAGGIDIFA
ncbi:flagellar hook-length control protein FliK [Salinisphaera sp. T31B1]|uniref:flagellar hook-length control protein FliK n=1 Tax=Salinisphaera sp. T31B1 TaxID=727963 RepID=UPI00333F9CE4